MRLPRRKFLQLAAGAATLPAMTRRARARSYPTRPVTIIVPFAPGGGADVTGRIVGEYMSRTLGQRFIIENFPGAGGTTGSIRTMRATPGISPTAAASSWAIARGAFRSDRAS